MDLYLDFDGVINYVYPMGYDDEVTKKLNRFTVSYHQTVIDWINHLPESINIVWLTTWNEDDLAVKLLTPELGISRSVSALGKPNHFQDYWWKWTTLREYREDRTDPFIWIDDDLIYERSARAWAYEQGGLWIAPQTSLGISNGNMIRVENYIREHNE